MAKPINLGTFTQYEKPVASIVHTFYADSDETTALNLTSYSARFDFGPRAEAAADRKTAAATVSDAANGEVTYAWDDDDMADVGNYVGELWVYVTSGARRTSRRFRWRVIDGVYGTPPTI